MLELKNKIQSFQPISLSEMDDFALMTRIDEKFISSNHHIADILNKINQQYSILEIDGKRSFLYQTDYLDTPNNILFNNHQNGKLNRYKIRFRDYIETKKSFLEVKFKSNKGITKKTRISVPFKEKNINSIAKKFIESQSPYLVKNLKIKVINNFERVTLVNILSKERVTIDFNLKFKSDILDTKSKISNLVVIEIKREKGNNKSPLFSILKQKKIRPTSFSKYAIGSCLLDKEIKYNRFKKKLLLFKKIT